MKTGYSRRIVDDVTAAAQKEIFRKALALPKKARLDLYNRLCESLDSSKGKTAKARSSALVVAESTALYGRMKAPRRAKAEKPIAEVLSKKEWDEAWGKELAKRMEEMESGEDPGVPLEVVWADLRKLAKKK